MHSASSAVSEITTTSSANLKWFNFLPYILIPFLLHSSFLYIPSISAFNNVSEIGSPCRTPLFISNFSQTLSETKTELLF